MASHRDLRDELIVPPGGHVRLSRMDAGATVGFTRASAEPEIQRELERLTDLQERLWAEGRHRILIVLQGLDTAGRGGTTEHGMGAFNPQGCRVHGFKVPTAEGLAHDCLWRVHLRVPRNGEISIFDRSHDGQVLVVRVAGLEPESRWRKHYDQINACERLLVDESTTILKFFLLIDRDEQRRASRRASTTRTSAGSSRCPTSTLEPRDRDIRAYEDLLARCSTKAAPWFIIPSNHTWFRNLAVARILADVLDDLNPADPEPVEPLPPNLSVEEPRALPQRLRLPSDR